MREPLRFPVVRMILRRELRDQLRDRRTLFLILGLPLLLYPLVGMLILRQTELVGSTRGGTDQQFWVHVATAGDPELLMTALSSSESDDALGGVPVEPLKYGLQMCYSTEPIDIENVTTNEASYGAVVWFFPKDFVQEVLARRNAAVDGAKYRSDEDAQSAESNDDAENGEYVGNKENVTPVLYWSTAIQRSMLAKAAVDRCFNDWNAKFRESLLLEMGVPQWVMATVTNSEVDVAVQTHLRGAAIWATVLPMLLLIFAMTGAFQAAVDLCTGDRERGTLETLLTAPASRLEIVVARLAAVTVPAFLTIVANLLSILSCVAIAIRKIDFFAYPSTWQIAAILLTAIPVAIFFAAISVALATFARTSREAQLYFVPLLLVVMPASILPAATAAPLTMTTALIPFSGLVLWLQNLISGNLAAVGRTCLPVLFVTVIGIILAVWLAVSLFRRETVLFRTADAVSWRAICRGFLRKINNVGKYDEIGSDGTGVKLDKLGRISGLSLLAGIVAILVIHMSGFLIPAEWVASWCGMILSVVATMAFVAGVGLVVAWLSENMRQTLSWKRVTWRVALGGVGLAVVAHPAIQLLGRLVQRWIPFQPGIEEALRDVESILSSGPPWSVLVSLLVISVLPGICEEILFRGVVLSGLRRFGAGVAICGSAILFGAAHTIIQQSITAGMLGVILAIIVLRTGSIFPAMLFHMTNNLLAVVTENFTGFSWWGETPSFYGLAGLSVILSVWVGWALLRTKKSGKNSEKNLPSY